MFNQLQSISCTQLHPKDRSAIPHDCFYCGASARSKPALLVAWKLIFHLQYKCLFRHTSNFATSVQDGILSASLVETSTSQRGLWSSTRGTVMPDFIHWTFCGTLYMWPNLLQIETKKLYFNDCFQCVFQIKNRPNNYENSRSISAFIYSVGRRWKPRSIAAFLYINFYEGLLPVYKVCGE